MMIITKYINFLMVLVNSMYDDYYIHFNLIFLGSSFIKFDSITQRKMYVMEPRQDYISKLTSPSHFISNSPFLSIGV